MADDSLSTYRAKRSPDRTPEPFGGTVSSAGNLFVVHKHAATRLHFDLRLEMDGVLRSWAVPKGPSYDQNDKRLAVKVEDHPIEYGDFEGIIPAGNYGAGGVIVWDRGEWVPLEDWREGLEKGKLLFELKGYKLHGKWTLVKIKKTEKEWLLIKERDSFMKSPGDLFPEESVLSGLTVEQVKAGVVPTGSIEASIEAAGAVRKRVDPRKVEAMHAETADEAFTKDGWIFELKLDGYRLIAAKTGGEALLLTRNGNDYTAVFPEIARAVKALPVDECILDGEVVVNDEKGLPSFAKLQRRGRLTSPLEIQQAAVALPAMFYVFDLLAFKDLDLRDLPLVERKRFLADVVPKLGPLRSLDHIEREGEAFMESVTSMGLEGIIAKKADSTYRKGRSDKWLKIKAEKTDDFVIVGFTAPQKSRAHFGALQLADYVNGELVYAGRVGTGFNSSLLEEIGEMLSGIGRKDPPCSGPILEKGGKPREQIPEIETTTWVDPVYVCEVCFREWTPDGLLRHSSFMRLRSDKRPHDCERQGWHEPAVVSAAPAPTVSLVPEKKVAFSNLRKVFWPGNGYTKGDLIEYYRAISPWLLPYLKNRPVVLTRFPDGIDGKSFYQKDAPDFAPSWIRTEAIWSEDTQRDIRYFVCDDVESIEYVINMGSIPLHIWNSRVGSLELPDWCVIDLDPKEAPFKDVITCALSLKKICDAIGMPAYVKTTGKSGLHILLPLGRQFTYEQCRLLGESIARLIIRDVGNIATITRHVTKRGDKVYLDYLQNRHGQLIVSPFSVRPLPGASVSMPLEWNEVTMSLDPRDYTIKTAVERMQRLSRDPVNPVIAATPDLVSILERAMTLG
ncbi:MAG TPA: DNA ligase D [Gemmatimonadaceae bacterium]|nr:DNA ligase D [Gemmatimonadaceae bacterium]